MGMDQYLLINTIFSGMNIHLPAIWGFTRYQGLTHPHMSAKHFYLQHLPRLARAERVDVPGPSPRHKDVLEKRTAQPTSVWGDPQVKIGGDAIAGV